MGIKARIMPLGDTLFGALFDTIFDKGLGLEIQANQSPWDRGEAPELHRYPMLFPSIHHVEIIPHPPPVPQEFRPSGERFSLGHDL